MSNSQQGFQERLREIIGKLSVKEAALKWGVAETTINSYFQRGSVPSSKIGSQIANAANVHFDWLLNGRGPKNLGELGDRIEVMKDATQMALRYSQGDERKARRVQDAIFQAIYPESKNAVAFQPQLVGEDFVLVPKIEARVSAGAGEDSAADGLRGALAFRKQWIERELRVRAVNLMAIEVVGDSMEPTLRDGDVVVVDRSQRDVISDGVFVIQDGSSAYVKRLQRDSAATITVISDNPRLRPIVLSDSASIVGRVVWRGGRL
jgi:phage repressor protein C with HTH and peptisase S24 domain